MRKLTVKQTAILAFVQAFFARERTAPTCEEIAAQFEFKVRASAYEHVKALERKGHLRIIPGLARGIRLVHSESEARDGALPLIGAIAAGSPLLAPENIESWIRIAPELYRPRADFLHRVQGSSMNRVVQDGDLVGIVHQATADNGQIIAAALPDPKLGCELVTLKRYTRLGDRIILRPDSLDVRYQPIEIDLARFEADSQDRPPFRIAGVLCEGLFRHSIAP